MALHKFIVEPDGVITSYHRIVFLMTTTNCQNSIAVMSYVNGGSRDHERIGALTQPYKQAKTYETAYDETMTIEKAYDYLKTLPEFEGATDV